jgi:hypothetical protein
LDSFLTLSETFPCYYTSHLIANLNIILLWIDPLSCGSTSSDIRESNNFDVRATAKYSNNLIPDVRANVEYDLVTPMQLYIRGHCMEVDISINNRQNVLNEINTNVIEADILDTKQLELRKIRNPVTQGHVVDRKIIIFEKINYLLFKSLGGIYKDGMALIISMERINLFEDMCDRLSYLNNDAINHLSELEKQDAMKYININYNDEHDYNSELIILGNKLDDNESNIDSFQSNNEILSDMSKSVKSNKNFRVLKDMKLRIFPERRIETFDEVIKVNVFYLCLLYMCVYMYIPIDMYL